MKSCPIFPVIGAITELGPNNREPGGVLYRYIEICEQGGCTQRLTIVRPVAALAGLIERHAIGIFLFCERQGERRLATVIPDAARPPARRPRKVNRAETF